MKKILIAITLFISLHSYSQAWGTNMEEAKKLATEQNKNILLVFSGSDWCSPCMKLEKNVWQSEEFKKEASHWILVKADFPKKKANQLAPELTKSNNELAEKYNKDGNFPLVLVLDKKGKVLGVTAYSSVDAEQYIDRLHELEKK